MSNDIMKTIISIKSDQLNCDDFAAGPVTVKIAAVIVTIGEQPLTVKLEGGHKPFKPCLTMRRVLVGLYGCDSKNWIGKRITLYLNKDEGINLGGGIKSGGVRISHAEGIKEVVNVSYIMTRGKRGVWKVSPLVIKDNTEESIKEALSLISQVSTGKDIENIRSRFSSLPADVKNARLGAAFRSAQERLDDGIECDNPQWMCKVTETHCKTACQLFSGCEKWSKSSAEPAASKKHEETERPAESSIEPPAQQPPKPSQPPLF
jgi:hypothetical protein